MHGKRGLSLNQMWTYVNQAPLERFLMWPSSYLVKCPMCEVV